MIPVSNCLLVFLSFKMASSLKNLSSYEPAEIPSAKGMRVGIVVSDWNREITEALLDGARSTLIKHQAEEENIFIQRVPGSFELVSGARMLADTGKIDGVICIGCVIRGDTPHFEYICQGVTQGISMLNVNYKIPFIFGVLTTNNFLQAKDRAGGKHGNKGDEAAITLIRMVALNTKR